MKFSQKLKTYTYIIYRKIVGSFSNLESNRFPFLRRISRYITYRLRPNATEIQGFKIFLDSEDSLGLLLNETYEPAETRLVKEIVKDGNNVLDIGANIGYYSLIFSKLVGARGRVFAFEPDPENFNLLKKNIAVNQCKNVALEQKAISDKGGKIRLYMHGSNKAGHRTYDSRDGCRSIEVEAISVDDYFKNFNKKVDFIKMDIEGAEWLALKGMKSFLEKNKNTRIMTEFWPGAFKK